MPVNLKFERMVITLLAVAGSALLGASVNGMADVDQRLAAIDAQQRQVHTDLVVDRHVKIEHREN